MAPPVYSVGQVLGAADCNNWFLPLPAYRTSTQSVTSSTVLVNDTQLFVSVAANAVYSYDLMLLYDGATGGDLQFQFTVPAGATVAQAANVMAGSAALSTDDGILAGFTNPTVGCLGTGTTSGLLLSGLLTTSSTSGTFQLQWAQVASSATATRVFAGSKLVLTRTG